MKRTLHVLIYSLIVNVVLVLLKVFVGILGNSSSMIADGICSIMSVFGSCIGIYGQKLSKKRANKEHPYGYGRVAYVASIGIGIFTLLLGGTVIVSLFYTQSGAKPSVYVMILLLGIVLGKGLLYNYMEYHAQKLKNPILDALKEDSEHEVYVTILVLLGTSLAQFQDQIWYFQYADRIAAIFISIIILIMGTKAIKKNLHNLLGTDEMNPEYVQEVESVISAIPGVKDIKKIDLCKYGSYYKATLVLELNQSMTIKQANEVIQKAKRSLTKSRSLKISYVVVEVIPYEKGE